MLWYTRWLCVITMSAVYVWCWQADTRYVREQLKLLRDVSSKIDKLSNYSVSTRKQVTRSFYQFFFTLCVYVQSDYVYCFICLYVHVCPYMYLYMYVVKNSGCFKSHQ